MSDIIIAVHYDDVVAHGANQAIVLQQIRFHLASTGADWFRASYAAMTDVVPLSRDQIRRALDGLVDSGALERRKTNAGDGNHTYEYRTGGWRNCQIDVADLPNLGCGEIATGGVAKLPNPPSLRDLKEKEKDTHARDALKNARDAFWERWPRAMKAPWNAKPSRAKWDRFARDPERVAAMLEWVSLMAAHFDELQAQYGDSLQLQYVKRVDTCLTVANEIWEVPPEVFLRPAVPPMREQLKQERRAGHLAERAEGPVEISETW